MNYAKIEYNDIANGTGIGVVLWVQGCDIHCTGCHNQQTWDFSGGSRFTQQDKNKLFQELQKPYITRFTISGGHPLDPHNFEDVLTLVKEIKAKFPTKDIWLYTGYLYEELYYREISRILLYIDVLVDGPYIEEQRDVTLAFRGSRNQRLINVPETLKQGKIITLQND
jgi:anaerobic ribonucleoside-triphosphate reductase activating protein